jgi:acetamidase/formamidase
MPTHRFAPTRFHNTIGSHSPCLRIADGDTVITETLDAHGFDKANEKRGERPNPMTGPFHVQGAEPGDTLAVKLIRISMIRATGWTYSVLAPNVVDPAAVPRFPKSEKTLWRINANENTARLDQPPGALAGWSVELAPMIGCFGVAPALGQAISTATSGAYGGNMDFRRFTAGVEVQFPVFAEGALFHLGDVHAAQADGEIVGTGIETAAEVEFSVHVIKGKRINWPRCVTTDEIVTIGNARPLDQALQHATTEMLNWLMEAYGLDEVAASHVMGQVARYDVANVFNPAYSVACRIGRSGLAGLARR